MHFYLSEKPWDKKQYTLKEAINEIACQYADQNQELGVEEFNKRIKPNLELLLMVVEEIKE